MSQSLITSDSLPSVVAVSVLFPILGIVAFVVYCAKWSGDLASSFNMFTYVVVVLGLCTVMTCTILNAQAVNSTAVL